MKKRFCLICILMLAMICIGGCSKEENEVKRVIKKYQEAINDGKLEQADSYCQLSDGKNGTWFYSSLAENKGDPVFIVAVREITFEQFEIKVDSVSIDGEEAIVNVKMKDVYYVAFIENLSQNYTMEQLLDGSVHDCKKLIQKDVEDYIVEFDSKIICKRIDNQWKITEFAE